MNEELEQLVEELKEELNSEELTDLNEFIKNYLEDENSTRSLVYILNKLEESKILKLASKSGRTINLLLEFIMARIDANACERGPESIIQELSYDKDISFQSYSKDVIDNVINDVIETIDGENRLLNENYYEADGTAKIRIL